MKRFKNILFVIDPEVQCNDAFARALTLAENNQANLTVVSIMEESSDGYHQNIHGVSLADLNDPIKNKQQQQLEMLVASMQKNIKITIKLLIGKAFLSIIQEVLSNKIDLVIKTVEEEKFMNRFLGSTDMHLLRKCPCPVWLMKSSQQRQYKKILAAVDFDVFQPKPEDEELNQKLIQMSLSLALSEFSELYIVHVWHAYGESSLRLGLAQQPEADVDAYVEEIRIKHQNQLDELLSKCIEKAGKEASDYIKPKLHLLKGDAVDKIPELVNELQIDLIMMGTLSRTGLPGFFMGNTSETILNRIDCSVLAVKPEGFVSPVSV